VEKKSNLLKEVGVHILGIGMADEQKASALNDMEIFHYIRYHTAKRHFGYSEGSCGQADERLKPKCPLRK
jgi:hypothetical protein